MQYTDDKFLGGSLLIRQPKLGFRAGTDAVLLASCINSDGGKILDVGSGVGTALLCAGFRHPKSQLYGIELQPKMVELAKHNAKYNNLSATFYCTSILDKNPDIPRVYFDHVITNPPFYQEDASHPSPHENKNTAHIQSVDLNVWIEQCIKFVAPKGNLSIIHRTDRLDEIISSLHNKLGAIEIIPLWSRKNEDAKRVIVNAKKGYKTGLKLKPGLVLHDLGRQFTSDANNILAHGSSILR